MFADPALYNSIVEWICHDCLGNDGVILTEAFGLPQKLADKLLYFLIRGSFSMNRSFQWKKDKDWYRTHRMIHQRCRMHHHRRFTEQNIL